MTTFFGQRGGDFPTGKPFWVKISSRMQFELRCLSKYDSTLELFGLKVFFIGLKVGKLFPGISSIHRGLVVRSDEPGGTFKWRLALIWHTLKIDTPLLFEIYEKFLFRLLAGWEWPQAFEWLCHPQFQVETKFQHILGFWGTFNTFWDTFDTFLTLFWHFF